MKKFLYILPLVLFAAIGANAQIYVDQKKANNENYPNYLIFLNYNIGFTSGNTNDYLEDTSFRGMGFEYRKFLNPNVTVGLSVDYQNFYEEQGKQNLDYNGRDLYGSQFNWMYSVPIMATAHYYPKGVNSKVSPYIGFGIGAYYNDQELTIGGVDFYNDSWQFGLAPEAGILVKLNENLGVNISGKYNYGFETGSLSAQSYWNIKTGLVFSF